MRVFADYMRRRGSAQHAYWRQKSTKHVLRICCAVYEEERGERDMMWSVYPVCTHSSRLAVFHWIVFLNFCVTARSSWRGGHNVGKSAQSWRQIGSHPVPIHNTSSSNINWILNANVCCALSSFLFWIRVAARLLLFFAAATFFHVRKELFLSLFIWWICDARLILLNCGKRKQLNRLIYCQTLEKIFMHSSARKINVKRKRF